MALGPEHKSKKVEGNWELWYEVVKSWGPDLGRGEWSIDYPKPDLIKQINLEWESQDELQGLRD